MSFYDAIKSTVKAASHVALMPLDVVADIATGGGDMCKGGETFTERRVKKAARELGNAYDETME